ncbi:helical backbone metal receptor [Nafulsella turpanensis]|uniref:helical backbone metal receptor n=1 Tax=Nafulsella turpanensis TaxID=1265690 RepID=UPI000346C614|nr:helical backbone metal receptor [Nafulsella turpanensis]
MPLYTDQMQRKVEVPDRPRRIISLVPSQTELLYSFGLEQEVVGLTKFCVHPAHLRKEKQVIGGTKNFHFDRIRALRPDLIIGNKEENYQEGIEELEKEFPVWMSDIFTLEDALQMVTQLGEITGRAERGAALAQEVNDKFNNLQAISPLSCLYFIWRKPYMVAGGNTFIDEMLQRCGFANVLKEQERYPELSAEDIRQLNPRLILLSSEPYPFGEKHVQEFRDLCPGAVIMTVDGEMFSWYGSRLLKAVPYFKQLQQEISSALHL